MADLTTAVCSITKTQRRRFFWAAWWTGGPTFAPFRAPDASGGGARTEEEALAEAQQRAGRHLALITPYWARAFKCVLRGQPPPAPPTPRSDHGPTVPAADKPRSAWTVLGVPADASLAQVKSAFRRRALETHPDQGGDAEQFRELAHAYQKVLAKLRTRARRTAP